MLEAILLTSALLLLVYGVIALWTCICNCILFTKFGEPWWKGLIPFYNTYVEMYYIWDTKFFWYYVGALIGIGVSSAFDSTVLYALFYIAYLVLTAMIDYRLSLAFGYGFGFAVGLFFLNFIFLPILALGSNNQYLGNPYYTDYGQTGYVNDDRY